MKTISKRHIGARQIFLDEPNVEDLEILCGLLNSGKQTPWLQELRSLVTAWQRSGQNLMALEDADQTLKQKIDDSLRKSICHLPMPTGRLCLIFKSTGLNGLALQMFTQLLRNPDWRKFGGPCLRCGKYFVRKTAKESVYCSHRCASHATAIRSTEQRRQEAHRDKIARALCGYAEWEHSYAKRRTKLNWKEWIAKSRPDITVKFLTRAVSKGEIQPHQPSKRKNR